LLTENRGVASVRTPHARQGIPVTYVALSGDALGDIDGVVSGTEDLMLGVACSCANRRGCRSTRYALVARIGTHYTVLLSIIAPNSCPVDDTSKWNVLEACDFIAHRA